MSVIILCACLTRSKESVAMCVMYGVLVAMMAAASSARVEEGFWPRSGPHSWSAGWWLSDVAVWWANRLSHCVGGGCRQGHQTPNDAKVHCGVRGKELPPSEKTFGVGGTGPMCHLMLGLRMVSRSCFRVLLSISRPILTAWAAVYGNPVCGYLGLSS